MKDNILLEAKAINKSFDIGNEKLKVLDDINLSFKTGEFVCIIGPSGCGKSTFLRIISGLMACDFGEVKKSSDATLSFVFQNFGLFPWLTVEKNIGFGLKMNNANNEYVKAEVDSRIKQMGLWNFKDKHPRELSGGMKQRVGIARALTMKPNILLLDEPFSSLDSFTAENLRKDLLDIWRKNNLTVIMVSHLIEEAVELSDRVIVMSANPGRIKQEVKIELPRPRDKRSKKFFEYVDQLSDLIRIDTV